MLSRGLKDSHMTRARVSIGEQPKLFGIARATGREVLFMVARWGPHRPSYCKY